MIHREVVVLNTAELLATEAYGAGALLRWESSATETGAYVEGGTIALVAGTSTYDIWDAAGVTGTWYRTRISNAAGTTFSPYTAPSQAAEPSFVSIIEVRALVRSRLSDSDLQVVIDREEAWLAGKIGTLSGARTETYRPGPDDQPVYLRRRAESVVVTDDGVTLVADTDYLFTPSTGMIRRVSWVETVPPWREYPLAWRGVVTVTSIPADGAAVKRAIIELVRGTVGETGLDSETIGDYSYTRGESAGRVGRAGLVRGILLRRPAYSMRLHSAMEAS